MNKLLALSFERMGYTDEYLREIERPLYEAKYLFQDEDRLILALKECRDRKRKLVVFPDFDVDGISAGCVFRSGLALLGIDAEILAPNTANGYGMSFADVDRLSNSWPDAHGILTCDVGIGAWDAIAYAQSKDLWVYVTDHHLEKRRSTADVVVDPCRTDSNDRFKGVCGAYVAWHVVTLFATLLGDRPVAELARKLVIFAGLGSCGDSMPVIHDTRAAIKASVAEFNALLDAEDMDAYFGRPADSLPEAYAAPFENLRAMHFWLVNNGYARPGDVDVETYGFTYCPMLNSVKRMGESLEPVYGMLYHRYAWDDGRLPGIFRWLAELNADRKSLTAELFAKLRNDRSQALAPYIYLIDAKPGVLGLLANKLMDLNDGTPCLVLRPNGEDGFSGSGRTPGWFCAGAVFRTKGVSVDGHEHAFGISVKTRSLQALHAAMKRQHEAEAARAAGQAGGKDPRIRVSVNGRPEHGSFDFAVRTPGDHDTCLAFAVDAEAYRPFGEGLEEPLCVLSFSGADIAESRLMGSDRSHLKLRLDRNIDLVWFGGAEHLERFQGPGPFHVEGHFGANRFNGSVYLQFRADGWA